MSRITSPNSRIILISTTALMLVALAACSVRPKNDFPPRPATPAPTLAGPNTPPPNDFPTPPATPAPTLAGPNIPPTRRPPALPPTVATELPAELTLFGFYDPQDQAVAAVEFRRRVARFERETNVKVVYELRPRQDISILIRTYLLAGVTLDLGPVLPEDIGDLVKAGILAQLDRLSPNQSWPRQSSAADRACVVEGKRYCVADDQGMAWIIPKNVPNPSGAIKLLTILFEEQ